MSFPFLEMRFRVFVPFYGANKIPNAAPAAKPASKPNTVFPELIMLFFLM
ncbi:MAG: hypothetical protein WAU21_09285 [Chitinophagales bacterium]|nr:hypothetical protein [Bacteroidota bacterium]MBK8488863.1 hypothetical protein [Bacteroidota bacterium]MBK8680715.1 hypothetical protein [Bacteroidota bacterium]